MEPKRCSTRVLSTASTSPAPLRLAALLVADVAELVLDLVLLLVVRVGWPTRCDGGEVAWAEGTAFDGVAPWLRAFARFAGSSSSSVAGSSVEFALELVPRPCAEDARRLERLWVLCWVERAATSACASSSSSSASYSSSASLPTPKTPPEPWLALLRMLLLLLFCCSPGCCSCCGCGCGCGCGEEDCFAGA